MTIIPTSHQLSGNGYGSPHRPNIIWIFGDQHRGQALGYRGDPNVHTPNIDNLAQMGLSPRGVSGTPLCCPFRGSLLTSRYPHECVPGHEAPLPDGMPTVAQPFNQAGYATGWFGKWHVDGFKEGSARAAFHRVPQSRRGGFSEWIGYENNNSQFDCWVHGHRENGEEVAHERLPGFETDSLTDLLLNWIDRRADDGQPFLQHYLFSRHMIRCRHRRDD